jgi:general secretion pathway protein D
MKLNKIITIVLVSFLILSDVMAKKEETININFKNLQINDLIRITSKIIDKNILLTQKINGKVDFVSNKPVKKSEILNVLIFVLESKGYTMIDNNGLLRIVRINDASKYNMPVVSKRNINTFQMITEIFEVENVNVDYVSSKIRHLISKSAKLVTDKDSNSVIITDFPANIKTIKKVIAIISKDNRKYIKTIKLKNIDAASLLTDIKALIKAIYNEKIEKEKVTVLLSKENNSLLLIGKKANVTYIKKHIENLDKEGSLVEKTVKVIHLKNAEAKNIIKLLTGVVDSKTKKVNPKSIVKEKPYISSDDEANSIILMGQKKQIKYYEDLIKLLDVDRQQVYVQARIIEVSEKKSREVGLKYGLAGSKQYSDGLTSFTANLTKKAILPSIPAVSLDSNGKASANNVLALGVGLNLLSQNGAADIVSEPLLLCINNKASNIYVGQTVSVKTSKTNGTTSTEAFKREDIGLTLKVKPRISNGGKVLLEIDTKIEDVINAEGANDQPDTSKKELSTSAIVNDGESIILGGYIRNIKSKTVDKVPFFGDLPLLGTLFRNNSTADDKINLIIIITPYIIPKSKNLTYIRDKLMKLKIMEENYTKDAILKLEAAKLNEINLDKKRKEEYKELLEENNLEHNDNDIDNMFE